MIKRTSNHSLAGYILHEMGFPIHLVAAVAPNDIVHRALSMGDLSANSEVASSWASAIDIQVPYNLERIVFMASGCNWQETRNIFQQFEATQQSVIPPAIVNSIRNCITGKKIQSLREISRVEERILLVQTQFASATRTSLTRSGPASRRMITSSVHTLQWP